MLVFVLVLALLAFGLFVFEALRGPFIDKLIAIGLALFSISWACYVIHLLHVQGKI